MESHPIIKKTALIYCRVSTNRQVGADHISLKVQEDKCRGLAESKGLLVRKVYIDKGKSGTTMKGRKNLMLALEDLKEGETIIVYDISRLSRNSHDGHNIFDYIKRKGAFFLSCNQKFDPNDPQGKFIISTMLGFSELEVEITRRKIHEAITHLKECGMVYNKIPYGKVRGGSDGRHLVDSEEELDVSRRIIEYREKDNLPFGKMAIILNREGKISPAQKNYKGDQFVPWTDNMARNIYEQFRSRRYDYEEEIAQELIQLAREKITLKEKYESLIKNRIPYDLIDVIIKRDSVLIDVLQERQKIRWRIFELFDKRIEIEAINEIIAEEFNVSFADIFTPYHKLKKRQKRNVKDAISRFFELKNIEKDEEKIFDIIEEERGIDLHRDIIKMKIKEKRKKLFVEGKDLKTINSTIIEEFPLITEETLIVENDGYELVIEQELTDILRKNIISRVKVLERLQIPNEIIVVIIRREFRYDLEENIFSSTNS